MVRPSDYFDTKNPEVGQVFAQASFVWEALHYLPDLIMTLNRGETLVAGQVHPSATFGSAPIYIAEGAIVEAAAHIEGPAYIGPNAVVRHGAYLRENCLVMRSALVGHASEMKNSILLPYAKAPHFAYVGDSILGESVNLGAGTRLSNLPISIGGHAGSVVVHHADHSYDTGLRKFGAVLGAGVETGCNVVTNPGVLIGPGSMVYPGLVVAKGVYPARVILKLRQTSIVVPNRS